MKKDRGEWLEYGIPIAITNTDQAIAGILDGDGMYWLHIYFVWAHLAIYATISGPQQEVADTNGWPLKALTTLRIATVSNGVHHQRMKIGELH